MPPFLCHPSRYKDIRARKSKLLRKEAALTNTYMRASNGKISNNRSFNFILFLKMVKTARHNARIIIKIIWSL